MTGVVIKESILQIASSGNGRYFVVTPRHIHEYENATLKRTYDLPSTPRSKLHLGINGWGIVCKSHIRTHVRTIPHTFRFFKEEDVLFLDEKLIYCSKTSPVVSTASINITNDLPPQHGILYEQDGHVWEVQPYSKKLARDLQQDRSLFTNVKIEQPVLTVHNPGYGKILPNEHFLGGSPDGVLTHTARNVYAYTVNGLQRKRIARVEGLQHKNSRDVFGALPEPNAYVVGWNEDQVGKWQIIHVVPFRKRMRRMFTYALIIVITIMLVCLVLGI